MRPWGGLFCLHWKLVGHWVEGSAPSWKGGSGAGHWVQLGGSRGGPSGPSGWKWPRWRKSHLSKSHASRCHATPVQFFAITNIAFLALKTLACKLLPIYICYLKRINSLFLGIGVEHLNISTLKTFTAVYTNLKEIL